MRLNTGLILSLCLIFAASSAGAAGASRQDLAQLEAKAKAKAKDSEILRAKAVKAQRDLGVLRGQLIKLSEQQARSEQIANDSRERLLSLNRSQIVLTTDMRRNHDQLARLLSALLIYRRNPPPALLVHPQNALKGAHAAILIKAITPELERRAKSFAGDAQEISRLRRETADAAQVLSGAERDIIQRRAEIEGLISSKAAVERSISADADQADRDFQKLATKAQSLRDLLRALPRQPRGPSKGAAGQNLDATDLFGRTRGIFSPVAGRVIRKFGQGGGQIGRSEGWTWRTEANATVRAPAQGTVEYAGPLKGWGDVLILRLGGQYHLVLAGMDTANAVAGRSLAAGEPVGRMGAGSSSGNGRAPELYLEIRKDGSPMDPARWLKAAGHP
jgi:septal ring factor EnvC (AmiA/AmiB activator)